MHWLCDGSYLPMFDKPKIFWILADARSESELMAKDTSGHTALQCAIRAEAERRTWVENTKSQMTRDVIAWYESDKYVALELLLVKAHVMIRTENLSDDAIRRQVGTRRADIWIAKRRDYFAGTQRNELTGPGRELLYFDFDRDLIQ